MYPKEETVKFIQSEVIKTYTFECPNCRELFDSEEDQSKDKFINYLIDEEKIKKINNGAMIGIFCPTCYNDPEFENCSL